MIGLRLDKGIQSKGAKILGTIDSHLGDEHLLPGSPQGANLGDLKVKFRRQVPCDHCGMAPHPPSQKHKRKMFNVLVPREGWRPGQDGWG